MQELSTVRKNRKEEPDEEGATAPSENKQTCQHQGSHVMLIKAWEMETTW